MSWWQKTMIPRMFIPIKNTFAILATQKSFGQNDFLTVTTTGPSRIMSLTAPHSNVHLLSKALWPTVGLQPIVSSHRRQWRFTSLGVTQQQMLPEEKRMFLSFIAAPSHICLLIKTQAHPSRFLYAAAIITLQLKICCKKISSGDVPCFEVCRKTKSRLNFPLTLWLSKFTISLFCVYVSFLKFITWRNERRQKKISLQSHFSAHAAIVLLSGARGSSASQEPKIPISAGLQQRRHKLDPRNNHQQ